MEPTPEYYHESSIPEMFVPNPGYIKPIVSQLRWMVKSDMDQVMGIETHTYPEDQAWTQEEFLKVLRRKECIGMVAEWRGAIVGYTVYGLTDQKIEILNLTVHPDLLRRGIGTTMLSKLKSKLYARKSRTKIQLNIRESNTGGQVFFRERGFLWVKTRNRFYGTGPAAEDAYRMEYVRIDDKLDYIEDRYPDEEEHKHDSKRR